ncbi:hypothetical protein GEMRC1_007227 [Eukaryota sp. GEM-RC1]
MSSNPPPPTPAPRDYHCNNCRANISAEVHIRCAECPDFDLCLNCFSVGVELDGHRKTHCYRVLDFKSKPLFEGHWSAEDELLLMEAIDLYGLCNWEGIAEHIGAITPTEVKRHYLQTYNHGTYRLPDPSFKPPPALTASPPVEPEPEPIIHDKAPSELPEPKSKEEEQERKFQTDVLYNPFRHDFVEEYRHDADKALVTFSTIKEDSAYVGELQLELFSAYHDIVAERAFRKDFVVHRNLLNPANRECKNKNIPEWERRIRNDTRVFAQFYPHHEHSEFQKFVDLLIEEQKVRSEFSDIIKGVEHGIKTVKELRKFVEVEEPLRKKAHDEHRKKIDKIRSLTYRGKSSKSTPK